MDQGNNNQLKPTSSSTPKRPVKKLNFTSDDAAAAAAEKSDKNRNAGQMSDNKPKRVWTDQGEIALLKGLADFAKLGKAVNDYVGFYEFIKGSIAEDFSLVQLRTKIRHTRDRFQSNESDEKNGCVLTFSRPHLQECHELARKIWGDAHAQPKDGEPETPDSAFISRKKNRKKRKEASRAAAGGEEENKKKTDEENNEEEQQGSVQVEDAVEVEEELEDKEAEGDSATGKSKNKNKKKKQKVSSAASVPEEEQEERQSVQVDDDVQKEKDGDGEGEAFGDNQKSKRKKSKKKRKAGNEASVSKKQQESVQLNDAAADNTTTMFGRQKDGFRLYEFIQGMDQMMKAPSSLESFLNQEALRLVEPSKRMELETEWKNLQINETEVFLKRLNLVRECSLIMVEALKSPS